MRSYEKMVEVEELRVTYGERLAVDDISFNLGQGQLFGLIGPNGAGKSSTLRCLAGIQEPQRGRIRIAGIDLAESPALAHREAGYMPDTPEVSERLLVWEYLEFFGAAMDMHGAGLAARVDRSLRMVGLSPRRESTVKSLSRGMRQRLGLARALIHDPSVLLLDEPLSGLDPAGRVEMLRLLRLLASEGRMVVLSSHILSEVAEVAAAVGVLDRGKLAFLGTVEDARQHVQRTRRTRLKLLGTVTDDDLTAPMRAAGMAVQWSRAADVLEVETTDDDQVVWSLIQAMAASGMKFIPAPSVREVEEVFFQLAGRGGIEE